ncbi:MAG: GTP-binding protein [Clostridia bacterium]|nr:GTP-binding protein [Clostridia bacterium]
MKKLPVILITGFLGAGKTTFLNELLAHLDSLGKSVALLINEFGRANIDKDLVDPDAGTIYEVNQGSIFCVCTRDQFIKALDEITCQSPAFDVAVIESTGIANTRDIGEYLSMPPLEGRLDIKQNFCLVDAANFHKVFETLPAVKSQVEEASVCVINKTDLADEEYVDTLENKLLGLNEDAVITRTSYGKVDFSSLLDLDGSWKTRSHLDTAPPTGVNSVTMKSVGVFSTGKLRAFLSRHSDKLLRAKGFIMTPDGPFLIEWVGDRFFYKPSDSLHNNESSLVLIGFKLNIKEMNAAFKACRF